MSNTQATMATTLFLHGLDSSSQGTKGRWFAEHFPDMLIPDFVGDLGNRLQKLEQLCDKLDTVVLVGSSFGGLMATCYAASFPGKCSRLILLAPALNFPEFVPPAIPLDIPTTVIIGEHDTVTPADLVLPLAQSSFANLEIISCDDDHLLHGIFYRLNWHDMLQPFILGDYESLRRKC